MNFRIKKPNFYSFEESTRLHSFLKRNVIGKDIDVRTPLFNKSPRGEIIAEWRSILEKNKSKLFDELYEDEIDQSSKIGRYSMMLPFKDRFNDVAGYFQHQLNNESVYRVLESNKFFKTLNLMKLKYKRFKGSIRLKSIDSVVSEIPLNTNSGLPFFDTRSKVVSKTIRFIKDNFQDIEFILNYCRCILGWRGQPIDKQRVIWMFPLILNILESQYYLVNTNITQTRILKPEFISSELIEEMITKLFITKHIKDLVISTDFTRFDWFFNQILQQVSWEMKSFKLNKSENHHRQNLIHFYKFNIPIICTDSVEMYGKHGMATGSSGTNTDENEANEFMQTYCALVNDSILNKFSSRLGDDAIMSYPGISVKQVVDVYQNVFGQNMNIEKQYVSTSCTKYLQRLYCLDYTDDNGTMLGCYSTMRALGRLIGQERFKPPKFWNAEMVTLRSLSILENCNRHPLFERFVDFVITGDKFKLGISLPGFLEKLSSMTLKDLYNDERLDLSYSKYLEYKANPKSGITNWRIIKYLNKIKFKKQ